MQVLILNNFNHRDQEDNTHCGFFDPERWLGSDTNYMFNHFSNGPQGCVGENLALFIAKAVLASLLSSGHYELRKPALAHSAPSPRCQSTSGQSFLERRRNRYGHPTRGYTMSKPTSSRPNAELIFSKNPWLTAPIDWIDNLLTPRHWPRIADAGADALAKVTSPDSTAIGAVLAPFTGVFGAVTAQFRKTSPAISRLDRGCGNSSGRRCGLQLSSSVIARKGLGAQG